MEPVGLLSLAHHSDSVTPGSREGHGGEDIAPFVCGIGGSMARTCGVGQRC